MRFLKKRGRLLVAFLCLTALGCRHKPRIQSVRVDRIKSISASSHYSWFDAKLVLDGGVADVNAWHSVVRPTYPQWIQVEYPEPVLLRRFTIQAQFNPLRDQTDNLRRAPRHLRVWGANNDGFQAAEDLGLMDCDFKSAGDWCGFDIPLGKPHAFYRFVIESNRGDPDFVSIQEMQFFSEEPR